MIRWRGARGGYVLRRVGSSLALLAATSFVIFVVLRIIPGDPTAARASRPGTTPQEIQAFRRSLGLDKPILEQYVHWIGGVVHGDFGQSYFSAYSATQLVRQALFPTFELAVAAVVLGVIAAVVLGILAATYPRSPFAVFSRLLIGLGISVPPFIVGIVLIIVFGVELQWLPTRGYVDPWVDLPSNLRDLAMPAVTMGLVVAAPLLRMLSASLAEELKSDYIRTARGTGMTKGRIVLRHALRNAAVPSVALTGLSVGYLLGGAVIVEYVFSWPGLGTLAIQAVNTRDYAVLQTVVLFASAVFIVSSLVADLVVRWLDPRIREGVL